MNMNKKELEAFAKEAAKGIKTPEDLNEFSQMLKKITVEAALNAEMDEHLGYEKNHKSTSSNSRNGKSSKRVKTEDGEFELDTPRDREGSFEPKLVKKHQSRFTSMDDKILWLYAQGMSTREIVNAFDEWYGAEISPTLVSRVTNAVIEQVVEWQSRPLDAIYPIVYLDCIVVKMPPEMPIKILDFIIRPCEHNGQKYVGYNTERSEGSLRVFVPASLRASLCGC
jgi:transposase-like protein